ncbi:malonyl-CoA decarboxylase domain-containing protein [Tianweitania sediminis]|uniref:Malonyl-CoA decarboxylase family protein n=1 Tax=Tianweitania sediminis TaxID=1502156 RepID=A0A8J7UHW9_9HYPH|nr:malonyl-CoA decarboxylase family protein [Tianweitania sediminis]MBP0438258.1 malonyl-CoA decarboxylase family protein [Tianweitania sediminis]
MKTTSFFADFLTTLLERRPWAEASAAGKPPREMCDALMSNHGEISGIRLAGAILARFETMNEAERIAFFEYLTEQLDVDADAVEKAARAYRDEPDGSRLEALHSVAEPRRQELLRRLNQAPGATGRLVRMRLDLLQLTKTHPQFARTDLDFVHLFKSWFNRGFLLLRHIDWHTPANILEKIIEYEAVHAINNWEELRRRLLPPDRRCFAFFHPAMPDDPLIFVEVALVNSVPGSIQGLLAETRVHVEPQAADTAVFYSISNCQEGLRGISFGNSLIKQVVEELSLELPSLRNFVTLSPIPGLARWIEACAEDGDERAGRVFRASREEPGALEELRAETRQLAALYLSEAKRTDGLPLDAVARFHLGNGALIHDVHALADNSPNGLRQSCGAMVNYLYDLRTVEQNHEDFVTGRVVASSREIKALARAASAAKGRKANA